MLILLTGQDGFVGRHLRARLVNEGHTVVPFTRRRDLVSDWGGVKIDNADAIINCAAELTDESKMFNSNVVLVRELLDLAHKKDIKKVITCGSSSEYGATNASRREDSICIPSNIYESTKLAATALCQGFASRFDLDVCVARPFSLYGDGDKPRKLIPSLYRSYLEHKPFDLFSGAHDWIWIDDFIDGLILLLNAPAHTTKGQIFNFGSGISSTNDDVVNGLECSLGAKLDIRRQAGKYHAHDVDNWVADISKARNVLGWEPKVNLNAGLKEYVMREWFAADRTGQGT